MKNKFFKKAGNVVFMIMLIVGLFLITPTKSYACHDKPTPKPTKVVEPTSVPQPTAENTNVPQPTNPPVIQPTERGINRYVRIQFESSCFTSTWHLYAEFKKGSKPASIVFSPAVSGVWPDGVTSFHASVTLTYPDGDVYVDDTTVTRPTCSVATKAPTATATERPTVVAKAIAPRIGVVDYPNPVTNSNLSLGFGLMAFGLVGLVFNNKKKIVK
jgi:hypothetical protein